MSPVPGRCSLVPKNPASVVLALGAALTAGVLLVQLPPFYGLVFVGTATVVIGTLIEPFVGLGTALFLGPLKAYLSAEVPQVPAQIAHVFVVLAIASWLARRLSKRDLRIDRSPLFVALLAFIGAALLSLWDAAGSVEYGLPELVKWLQIVIICIFVGEHLLQGTGWPWARAGTCRAGPRLRWLVVVLLGVGLFQAGVGIWQFALRGEGPEHFAILGGDLFRAYGTFEQPNPYAGYLGLTAALALGIAADGIRVSLAGRDEGGSHPEHGPDRCVGLPAWWPTGPALTVFAGSVALVMLVALGASWSRGAWMGFGAATLAVALSLPRRAGWGLLLVIALAVVGVGLYASSVLPPSLTARLTSFARDVRLQDVRGVAISDANYAVIERMAHWQAALSMFRHNLWVGVGFGGYEAVYSRFAFINWPIALGHAHNIYLNLAAETGVIGLVAYTFLWIVIFRQTWRVTRRARGLSRGLAVGLLGAWTHLSVHHLLDNVYVNNAHLSIGVLFGILVFIHLVTGGMTTAYDC